MTTVTVYKAVETGKSRTIQALAFVEGEEA